MKLITLSREFGSGGRELGKRMADLLQWDYYDREIIAAVAEQQRLDSGYVEHALDQRDWQAYPLTFRRSFLSFAAPQTAQAQLLVAQKRVVEEIAAAGRDCIIVGRNADVLLQDRAPFRIFVCAEPEARVRRCMERAETGETLSRRDMEHLIRRIDKSRAHTRELLSDRPWGQPEAYDLTINTTDWAIRELAPAVAELAARWFGRTQ